MSKTIAVTDNECIKGILRIQRRIGNDLLLRYLFRRIFSLSVFGCLIRRKEPGSDLCSGGLGERIADQGRIARLNKAVIKIGHRFDEKHIMINFDRSQGCSDPSIKRNLCHFFAHDGAGLVPNHGAVQA